MSPTGFVAMIENFNETQRHAICDMGFRGFLHLQVIELPGDLYKWLVDSFDPYSITLYISVHKKIEITPMDVYLTLALLIDGRKVEEFYGKNQNTLNTMKSSHHGERSRIGKMGPQSSAKRHNTY